MSWQVPRLTWQNASLHYKHSYLHSAPLSKDKCCRQRWGGLLLPCCQAFQQFWHVVALFKMKFSLNEKGEILGGFFFPQRLEVVELWKGFVMNECLILEMIKPWPNISACTCSNVPFYEINSVCMVCLQCENERNKTIVDLTFCPWSLNILYELTITETNHEK